MKKLFVSLIGAVTLGAALPALAGPDWQLIEHARQAKQAKQTDLYEAAGPTAAGLTCPPKRPTLKDHGPRAQTAPTSNQQQQARYEADLKACQAAGK